MGQAIRPVQDLPEPLPLLPLVVTDHIAQSSCLSERSEDNTGGVSRRRQGCGAVWSPSDPSRGLSEHLSVDSDETADRDRPGSLWCTRMHVSQGTIVNRIARCADTDQGFAGTVRRMIAQAPVKHMDETGIRVEGTLHWRPVVCTTLLTFFWIGAGHWEGERRWDARRHRPRGP